MPVARMRAAKMRKPPMAIPTAINSPQRTAKPSLPCAIDTSCDAPSRLFLLRPGTVANEDSRVVCSDYGRAEAVKS